MTDNILVPLYDSPIGTLPIQAINWYEFIGSQPAGGHLIELDRIYTDYIASAMYLELDSTDTPADPVKWQSMQRSARSAAKALGATDRAYGGLLSNRIANMLHAKHGDVVDIETLRDTLTKISELDRPKSLHPRENAAVRRDMVKALHNWWIDGVPTPIDISNRNSSFVRLVRFIARDNPSLTIIQRDIEKIAPK